MQIKITVRYRLISVRVAVIKKTRSVEKDAEQGNPSALLVEMSIGAITMDNSTEVPQKLKVKL